MRRLIHISGIKMSGGIPYLIIDGGPEAISAEVLHGLLEKHPGLIVLRPQQAEEQGIMPHKENVTQIIPYKRFELTEVARPIMIGPVKEPYKKGEPRKRQTDFKQRMREAMKKRR